jgi:hypothetical protein
LNIVFWFDYIFLTLCHHKITIITGVTKQIREITAGNHWTSQNHKRVHFGLGHHQIINKLMITWMYRQNQVYHDIAADQLLVIPQISYGILGNTNHQQFKPLTICCYAK